MNFCDYKKPCPDVALFAHALAFAAAKHRNQRQDNADACAYINHPIALVHLLTHEGAIHDATVLCAALLHDTIEQTNTRAQELRDIFGSQITDIVLELTDDYGVPLPVRQRQQIERAPHLSKSAQLIKLADKICNVRDIFTAPSPHETVASQRAYIECAAHVIAGLRGVHPQLEMIFDALYADRDKLINLK